MYTNLRDLLVTDHVALEGEPEPAPLGPGEVRPVRSDIAIYEKPRDMIVFIVGENGESIMALEKPSRVILPLVRYPPGPKGEIAVQERIVSLIEAPQLGAPMTKVDKLESVEKYMRKAMKQPLHAVLADETAVELVRAAVHPDVKVFVSALPIGQRVYGLPEPKLLGRIAIGRTGQGLMVHGRPVVFQVQMAGVPIVEMATPGNSAPN